VRFIPLPSGGCFLDSGFWNPSFLFRLFGVFYFNAPALTAQEFWLLLLLICTVVRCPCSPKKKGGKSVEKRDDWGNDIMFISLTMSDGTLAKRKFLEWSNDVKLLFWD